jgi:hypothetical protein
MAYVKLVSGRSYPYIYNVTMAVGCRKELYKEYDGEGNVTVTTLVGSYLPNKPDDVMLVQYLLKKIYLKADETQGRITNYPSDITKLKIDGIHGPKTQAAIEQFQLQLRRSGKNNATDGAVDPELGLTSSISKTDYTITWLNKYLWVLHPNLAPDIAADPECPTLLKDKVLTPFTTRI